MFMKKSFQVVLLTMILKKETSACREPDNNNDDLASALLDIYLNDKHSSFSFNIIPCLTCSNIIKNDIKKLTNTDIIKVHYSGACRIPSHGGFASIDADIHKEDMCPLDFVIDFDEDRLPKRLAKAVCKCRHYLRGSCRPVNSYIPVLKKECNVNTGVFMFNKYIEEVPVGCRCFRSKEKVQGDTLTHQLFRTSGGNLVKERSKNVDSVSLSVATRPELEFNVSDSVLLTESVHDR